MVQNLAGMMALKKVGARVAMWDMMWAQSTVVVWALRMVGKKVVMKDE